MKTADEFGKHAFDLGNRVEDALKRVEDKLREIGDLPARLRAAADAGDAKVAELDEAKGRFQVEADKMKALREQIEAERNAQRTPPAPGTVGTGGQDGPGGEKLTGAQNSRPDAHTDQAEIARQNAETLEDVRRRTERPTSEIQTTV